MSDQRALVRKVAVAVIVAMVATGLWVGVAAIAPSPSPPTPAAGPPAGDAAAVPSTAAVARAPSPPPSPPPSLPPQAVRVDMPDDLGPAGTAVILALHGRGDTARAFAGLAGRLLPAEGGLSWRGLQGSARFGRGAAWFGGDRARPVGLEEAVVAIAAEVRQLAAEGRPVVLFGFSQGCMTAAHVALRAAADVVALVCVGGAVVGTLPALVDPDAPRPKALVVAGRSDAVVPLAEQRALAQALESRGLDVERIEHIGGHSLPSEVLAQIGGWLRPLLATGDARPR